MRVLLARYSLLISLGVAAGVGPLCAQRNRLLVDAGWGSLAEDPFHVMISFRGSAGWIVGTRDAFLVQFTRQGADETAAIDNGPHQLIAFAWHHALRPIFEARGGGGRQYMVRLTGGILRRRNVREAANGSTLRAAPFVGVGIVIRYPFSSRFAAVGTLEDVVAFVPAQTVSSYCEPSSGTLCYPPGGPDFHTVPLPRETRNNFGAFVTLEFRP